MMTIYQSRSLARAVSHMIGSPASSDRAYPASAASFRAKRNLCFNHMDQIISCPDSSLDIDQDGVGMTKAPGRAFAEKGRLRLGAPCSFECPPGTERPHQPSGDLRILRIELQHHIGDEIVSGA